MLARGGDSMREALETQQVEELAHDLDLLEEELFKQTGDGVKPVQLDQEAVGRVSRIDAT